MPPSEKAIFAALKSKVQEVFDTDRDNLTVRYVRDAVEEDLGLEAGYLTQGTLKDKWKKTIKDLAVGTSLLLLCAC